MKKYKVINTYPDAKFEKDEILIQYFFDPPSTAANYCYITNPENPLQGGCIDKQYVENMPHLFQEITSDTDAFIKAVQEASFNIQSPELKIDGKQPIFHVVMDRNKWGLSEEQAMQEDMAKEYAIIAEPSASAGLMVYGKHLDGNWAANPWSVRFLIRELLEKIGIVMPQVFIVEKFIKRRSVVIAGEAHNEEQWERKTVELTEEAARTAMFRFSSFLSHERYRVVDYSGKVIFTIEPKQHTPKAGDELIARDNDKDGNFLFNLHLVNGNSYKIDSIEDGLIRVIGENDFALYFSLNKNVSGYYRKYFEIPNQTEN